MRIQRAFVTPFSTNNECFAEPQTIISNLDELKRISIKAKQRGIEVYPLFITIGHPEGNFKLPNRYRWQVGLDGKVRPGFVCFQDKARQLEVLQYAKYATEIGFERIAFDDDFRDAFCYCDEHLKGFAPFRNLQRGEVATLLNDVENPEHEQLRTQWYGHKLTAMKEFAVQLERTVHKINPCCRIGIFNSAKRCQDFSGRNCQQWADLFSSDKAPVFVRLCGECYDDNILHLVQSTGWHSYFKQCYKDPIEKMLEITSVPLIAYRSPGVVVLESKAVSALTGIENILWAWTEEFVSTDLPSYTGLIQKNIQQICSDIPNQPDSPLSVYIGHDLGPYTPPKICTDYGAANDPLTAYTSTALVGLPVMVSPEIGAHQKAIMCAGYISRQMIKQIDTFTESGGICVLDAISAKMYSIYGGRTKFSLRPVSLNRFETGVDGKREDFIAHLPPDSVYVIENCAEIKYQWNSFDINAHSLGITCAILSVGQGFMIILGYDISRALNVLIRPQWRERLLDIFSIVGIKFPIYWSGPIGVQCINYGQKACVINYNTNFVTGRLISSYGVLDGINVSGMNLDFINLR
jgi:hypothetical protein